MDWHENRRGVDDFCGFINGFVGLSMDFGIFETPL